jgi:hypothetical protein
MPYNPLNFTTLPSFVAARPNLRLHTEFAPLTSDRIAGALWEPPVRVANHLTSEGIIDRTPLSVMSDGKVDLSIKYTGEFSCHMRIEPYPFDSHDCYIEVTMPMTRSTVVLDGSLGIALALHPEGFDAFARNTTTYITRLDRDPTSRELP